jgi:hypothetical protein
MTMPLERAREGGLKISPPLARKWSIMQKRYCFRGNELNKSFRISKSLQKTNSKTARNDTGKAVFGAKKAEKVGLSSARLTKKCRFSGSGSVRCRGGFTPPHGPSADG